MLTEPASYDYDAVRAMIDRFGAIPVGSGLDAIEGREHGPDAYALDRIGRIAVRLPDDTKASPVYIRGAGAKPQSGFAIKHV